LVPQQSGGAALPGADDDRNRIVPGGAATDAPAVVPRAGRACHMAGGYARSMTDYSEQGAVPVEDARVADPPTVDDVLERQRAEYPEQARTSSMAGPASEEEAATEEAGGEVVDREPDGSRDIEGPNSA
jgi:hypothetical protein